MSFLTVNGWAIPILDGSPSEEHDIGGDFARTLTGARFSDELYDKRVWKGTTPPVTEMVAEAVKGAVRGLGHAWAFDGSLYSSKGLGPTGSTAGVFAPGQGSVGLSGNSVSDELTDAAGTAGSKYGSHALRPQGAITNVLAANQRDVEDGTTGFTALGAATRAANTAQALQGLQSLAVTGMAAGTDGVQVDAIPVTASHGYVFSVYVQNASVLGGSIDFEAIGDVAGSLATLSAQNVGYSEWNRIDFTFTAGASDSTVDIKITRNSTITSMWIDALQMHSTTTSTRGTQKSEAWVDGSGAAHDLEYSASFLTGATGLTISLWARVDIGDTGTDNYLVAITKTTGVAAQSFVIAVDGASLRVVPGGGSFSLTGTLTTGWKLITLVIRPNAETGENEGELYLDGVSIDTTATVGTFVNFDALHVGHNSGSDIPDALIDDLVVLPYAAPAEQVLAWYDMGKALPALSRYYVDGDAMPDDAATVLAEGDARTSAYAAAHRSGSFRSNLRQVDIEVWEV